MAEIPVQVIRLGVAVLSLGAVASFAGFFLGWIRMEKKWQQIDKALVFTGLTSMIFGLTLYFGLFALDFISPGQNFTIGFIFTPIGSVILLIGMLKPCKFNLGIPR